MNKRDLFFQAEPGNLNVERLPDGSMAIYDHRSKSIHSLDRNVAALWDACADGATMPQLAAVLNRGIGVAAGEDEISSRIAQMRELNLIVSDAAMPVVAAGPSRRSVLSAVGAVLPIILTMTAAEQRASAVSSLTKTL